MFIILRYEIGFHWLILWAYIITVFVSLPVTTYVMKNEPASN
jgi:hypothetical protein